MPAPDTVTDHRSLIAAILDPATPPDRFDPFALADALKDPAARDAVHALIAVRTFRLQSKIAAATDRALDRLSALLDSATDPAELRRVSTAITRISISRSCGTTPFPSPPTKDRPTPASPRPRGEDRSAAPASEQVRGRTPESNSIAPIPTASINDKLESTPTSPRSRGEDRSGARAPEQVRGRTPESNSIAPSPEPSHHTPPPVHRTIAISPLAAGAPTPTTNPDPAAPLRNPQSELRNSLFIAFTGGVTGCTGNFALRSNLLSATINDGHIDRPLSPAELTHIQALIAAIDWTPPTQAQPLGSDLFTYTFTTPDRTLTLPEDQLLSRPALANLVADLFELVSQPPPLPDDSS